MGSRRLPGKMLLDLHGLPVIGWVVKRLAQSSLLSSIVVAIPDTKENDVLADYLNDLGIDLYRNSEEDVLTRFIMATRYVNADYIVRICADNPLVCASEIDHLIDFFLQETCDYAYNHIPRNNNYPDGLGGEITSRAVLEKIDQEAVSPAQREHVFNFLWDNPGDFTIATFNPVDPGLKHPELKLDLDTNEDYQRLLGLNINPDMSAQEIIDVALA